MKKLYKNVFHVRVLYYTGPNAVCNVGSVSNPGIYYRIGCGALTQDGSTLVLFCLQDDINGRWQIRHSSGDNEDSERFELFRESEQMAVEMWSPNLDL